MLSRAPTHNPACHALTPSRLTVCKERNLISELIELVHGLLVDIFELAKLLRNLDQRIIEAFLALVLVSAFAAKMRPIQVYQPAELGPAAFLSQRAGEHKLTFQKPLEGIRAP